MTSLRKLFGAIFLAVVTLAAAVYFSIKGEDDHLRNCETLGISCEKGRVHQATDSVQKWLNKKIEKHSNDAN